MNPVSQRHAGEGARATRNANNFPNPCPHSIFCGKINILEFVALPGDST
jgi:hypothetical protein